MIKFLLQTVGWTLAHLPEPLLRLLCAGLGRAMLLLAPRRRRLVYSNLDHAFPEQTEAWKREIAHQSSRRLFETALLSLAGPFLSPRRIQHIISVSPEVLDCFREHHAEPFPLIVAAPHMAYWESLTWLGLFLPHSLPEFGVIFRPLDNPAADAWVKMTRERYGMRLLSRKTGLQESFKILKRKGTVGILFDQNAGMQGALTTLCGRVCSTSELPGLLAEKNDARVIAFYARRLDFWRLRFELTTIRHDGSAPSVILGLNRWLETALGSDSALSSSWLWSHDRWRNQDVPERRFRLEAKRNLLHEDLASHGWTQLPRKTRVFVRMPNWLGDVVMALPLLRALRASRPDAELTLIAKGAFHPLLRELGVADHLEPLPPRGAGYFLSFWKRRRRFPDVYVLFTNSTRGDLEAWFTRCRQRFGVVRHGRSRRLLTHAYVVPTDFHEAQHHQLELWENFFRQFGLAGPIDRSPFAASPSVVAGLRQSLPVPLQSSNAPVIGFIAGSENTPEKRWPVERWRALIRALCAEIPTATFVLLGTKNDAAITRAIGEGLGSTVVDLAGKTDLPAYMATLQTCALLISNDTGGMHLANALGVPVVGVFGPTNPVRTGPVFGAPFTCVQPDGCPPTGGKPLTDLPVDPVLEAARRYLASR